MIIRQGSTYHVFYTGRGIPMLTSPDLINWKADERVFEANPAWIAREVPEARDIWAPDISFRDGKYWLYYAVSTFGSNLSAIGLATNTTLDRASPAYRWEDQGMVIKSEPVPPDTPNAYNCIDANYVMDAEGRSWLAFGSFWSGHKIFELDPKTGKALGGTPKLHHIAGRPVGYLALVDDILDHLYVGPEHQNQGVGSLLMAKAKALRPAGLRLYAFQRNRHARAFYEARGFMPVEFSDGTGNQEGEPDVLYRWRGARSAMEA